jgi:uncharacterized protein
MERTTNSPRRFIADAMLGKLAKWLRILGYDVAYERKIDDDALIERAGVDGRMILTRDARLIRRRLRPRPLFLFIEDDRPLEQLRQAVLQLGLSITKYRFSRCIECNALLGAVEKDLIQRYVPEYVFRTQDRFSRCPQCLRIYWEGTHSDHIRGRLRTLFGNSSAAED